MPLNLSDSQVTKLGPFFVIKITKMYGSMEKQKKNNLRQTNLVNPWRIKEIPLLKDFKKAKLNLWENSLETEKKMT